MPITVDQMEVVSRHEEEQVLRWRYDQLRRSGYSESDAALIADRRDIDLHLATNLLGAGCPAETALRILF